MTDLTGKRYGRLVVTGIYKHAEHGKTITWNCICDCGQECQVPGSRLKQGVTKSCGCLQRELSSKRGKERWTKHGCHQTRLYRIWACMRNRCSNPNYTHYESYGGRGIKVCDEWQDFITFQIWATENGYSEKLTLDRIDVDKNYEPTNCRWVTMKEQGNNRRTNILLTYKGETLTRTQMAEKYNLRPETLKDRLNRGWPLEKAIETPVKKKALSSKGE